MSERAQSDAPRIDHELLSLCLVEIAEEREVLARRSHVRDDSSNEHTTEAWSCTARIVSV
jgi:hypothetical protein